MAEDLKTSKFLPFDWTKLPAVWRYGISVLAVAVSLILTYLFQPYVFRTPLFFLAIMISTWAGGTGPGLLAALLSTLSMYITLNPHGVVATVYPNVPNVIAFLLTSLLVGAWSSSRRRVERELQLARDDLEAKVQQRTADLKRKNEQLRKEISERRRVEDTLRESKEILQKIFDNVPITISFYDEDGRLVLVNREYERTFGWTVQELDEQNIDVFVEAFPDPAARQRVLDFLGAATGEWTDFNVRAKDGRVIKVWGAVVRASDGTSIAIGQDITERESLKEQLLQSQKMEAVGQLAGGVAHDFNNLLTAIRGYGELIQFKLRAGDPLRRHIEEIMKAADRAVSLTSQLLAFSRKQIIQPKILNINDLIGGMQNMLLRLIGEDVKVEIIRAADLGNIEADPSQIEQIVLNLCVNARDAMPQGGKLIIETENITIDENSVRQYAGMTPGSYVQLTIRDSGVGMSKETKERMFEPFFTTKKVGKGTGLGLSTVYGIVRQTGGSIRVESEPGAGTTFKIYLPRVYKATSEERSVSAEPKVRKGAETVLLAEDEEIVRHLAREILEMNNYRVLEASNGKAAMLACQQHREPIHLLITDVVMPEMSGRELAERLSRLHPEMRFLFISGYTDDAMIRHGVLHEETNFLQKPFSADIFLQKIREVLDAER